MAQDGRLLGVRGRGAQDAVRAHTSPRGGHKEDTRMGIIGWIVFGLIVGAVAKFLMPGRDPGGWIITSCWALLERWWGECWDGR